MRAWAHSGSSRCRWPIGVGPGRLGPAACARVARQARAPDGDHVRRSSRVLDAVVIAALVDAGALVATVAGSSGDRHARVIVVSVEARLVARLGSAVAVRDGDRAKRHGGVDRDTQVGEAGVIGLNEQDVAVRTRGRNHVDVERDLDSPACVGRRIAGTAVLIHLAEAAVGSRARGSPYWLR